MKGKKEIKEPKLNNFSIMRKEKISLSIPCLGLQDQEVDNSDVDCREYKQAL